MEFLLISLSIILMVHGAPLEAMSAGEVKVVTKEELASLMPHTDTSTAELIRDILDRCYEAPLRHVEDPSTSKYGKVYFFNPEDLAYLMRLCKGKTVLEIAGAQGDNALCLGLAGAKEVCLNDVAPAEIERFKKSVQRLPADLQKKFRFLRGDCFDVLRSAFCEGYFDIIYARNFIHFFLGEKRDRLIALLYRLCKPGGCVMLTAHSVYSDPASQEALIGAVEEPYVFQVYTAVVKAVGQANSDPLFQQLTVNTDDVNTLDPLSYSFIPAVTFGERGSMGQEAFFKILTKENQEKTLKFAEKLIEINGLEPLINNYTRITLHNAPSVRYSTNTLQKAFSQYYFKVVGAWYTNTEGHVTHVDDERVHVTIELEKPLSNRCAECTKGDASSRCSQCKSVYYCNEACQKAHWQNHKTICKVLRL